MNVSSGQSDVENVVIRRTSTFTNSPIARLVSELRGTADLRYWPLQPNQIRILCLKPGAFNSPLRCRLKYVPLACLSPDNSRPIWAAWRSILTRSHSYEAISYAWGSPVFNHRLHIKGHGSKPITKSLYDALQQLRSRYKTRRLWADAVCIDQTNGPEVALQVKHMSSIFGSAEKVLVWLGPAESSDSYAFAALTTLNTRTGLGVHPEQPRYNDLAQALNDIRHCGCCRSVLEAGTESISAQCIRAMLVILDRRWFSRMWVIQEVLSANKVEIWLGPHHTQWSNFLLMLGWLNHTALHNDATCTESLSSSIQDIAHQISDLSAVFLPRRDTVASGGKFFISNVLDKMSAFSSFGCSDSRDRVFAARTVLQVEALSTLEPDYQRPRHEVFRELVRACFTVDGNRYGLGCRRYELLALVGTVGSGQVNASWPSWVPNFANYTPRSRYKHTQYSCLPYNQDVSTFQEWPPDFKMDLTRCDENKLGVRGRVCGTIREVWPSCSWPETSSVSGQPPANVVSRYSKWFATCKDTLSSTITDHDDLCLLLTRGYWPLKQPGRPEPSIGPSFRDSVLENHAELSHQERETLQILIHEATQGTNVLQGMHIVVDPTELLARIDIEDQDIIAWIPKTACVGDKLCCFSGAPYPFVVRGEDEMYMRLLGDAYTLPLTFRQVFGSSGTEFSGDLAKEVLCDWRYTRQTPNLKYQEEMRKLTEGLGWIVLV